MRLCLFETTLSRDDRELRQFLVGFLAQGRLVKFCELLQLRLGELVGIGGNGLLLDVLPVYIGGQKPLQDLPLRCELRILLHLVFHDLCDNLRQTLIDLHHDEQILRSLAMALSISQSDDRGEPKGNCDQARAQQYSHDTILLGRLIPHAGGTYPRRRDMLHMTRLTMVYFLVPILLLMCMPLPGSSRDAKGNYVALGFGLASCQTFLEARSHRL